MNENELSALIDHYGATLERWPAAARAAAETQLATSSAARTLLRQAQTIEALLSAGPNPADISPERRHQVMTRTLATISRPQPSLRKRLVEEVWAIAVGWGRYGVPIAVGVALGVVIGHVSLPLSGTDGDLFNLTHTNGLFES